MFLSFRFALWPAAFLLISGCESVPAPNGSKHVEKAVNNGAKFRFKEKTKDAAAFEWHGEVDANGFASGLGRRVWFQRGDPSKRALEIASRYQNGLLAAGPFEKKKFDEGNLVYSLEASIDKALEFQGRFVKSYFGNRSDSWPSREEGTYLNGQEHGTTTKTCPDGTKTLAEFVNGNKVKESSTYRDGSSNVVEYSGGKMTRWIGYGKDGSKTVTEYKNGREASEHTQFPDGTIKYNTEIAKRFQEAEEEERRRTEEKEREERLAWERQEEEEEREAERRKIRSQRHQQEMNSMFRELASVVAGSSSSGSTFSGGSPANTRTSAASSGSNSGRTGSRLTLTASGTAYSDQVRDSKGNPHSVSVEWGPREDYGNPTQAKAAANREVADKVRRINAGYAEAAQRKAEERRMAEDKARRAKAAHEEWLRKQPKGPTIAR